MTKTTLGLIAVLLSLILFTGIVSAEYEIKNITTENSIEYRINPHINESVIIYFDNELIDTHTKHALIFNNLNPDTRYTLTLYDSITKEIQTEITTTKAEETKPFYLQYGIIGLFALICIMLYLSTRIPYIGYVTMTISAVGLMYVIKYTSDFIIALIFVILMFTSFMIFKEE